VRFKAHKAKAPGFESPSLRKERGFKALKAKAEDLKLTPQDRGGKAKIRQKTSLQKPKGHRMRNIKITK